MAENQISVANSRKVVHFDENEAEMNEISSNDVENEK